MPIAWRISAPAPVAKASGTTPITNAAEVIRIGRNRRRAASIAAAIGVLPANSSSRANSTIRIAFFAERPTSTMSPICVKMLLSPWVSHTPVIAAISAMGTMRMMESGSTRLS